MLIFVNMGGKTVLVDRVTGYIRVEQTPNQGTDAAIKVIQDWSLLFGFPLRVISDAGGGFRNDFKKKLKISAEMTGSANDRFLMRSVRSGMPNSINTQLDPQMLIHRRIENHEKKIKNENKDNKLIYEIGAV